MRYVALCLGIAPILALAAVDPIEHFIIGRWVILFDESLTRYAQKNATRVCDFDLLPKGRAW